MPAAYPAVCANGRIDASCPFTPTYENRECTSGAAWWASQVLGRLFPRGWGSALTWPFKARSAGWTVDASPVPNATIMALAPDVNGAGDAGHVAWVVGVDTVHAEVTVWQYNGELPPHDHEFSVGIYPIRGAEFIHLPGATPPPPASEESDVFQVITPGDPPLPVSSFTGGSTLNLVSELGCSPTVFAYLPTGQPLVSPTLALRGNRPGVLGPVAASGFVADLLGIPASNEAREGPLTLVFYPAANPYTVMLRP